MGTPVYSEGTRVAGPMQTDLISVGGGTNGAALSISGSGTGAQIAIPSPATHDVTKNGNWAAAGVSVGMLVEGGDIRPNTYVDALSTTTMTLSRTPINTSGGTLSNRTMTFHQTAGGGQATTAQMSGVELLAGSNITITPSTTATFGRPAYTLASTASGSGDVAAGSTFTTANVLMVCDGDDKTIDEPSGTITTNSQGLTVGGALAATTGTFSGILKTDNTTAATSITDGSLQTDGGLSVTFDAVIGDDIILISDGAVIHFGVDKDTTLTHTDGSGLTLNSTNKLMFGDSGTYIHQSADSVLDLVSDSEIELNGQTIDINASTEVNVDTPSFIVHSSTSDKPDVLISNTNDDATGPSLEFSLETSNSAAVNDVAGTIHFKADDSANAQTEYGRIQVKANAVTNGSESGKMFFGVHTTGGGSTGAYADVMTITGGANAAGSTVEIAGNLTVTGDTIYHSETVQVVEDNSLAFRAGDGNDHEVILTAADATADRTITMPDLGGHMAIMAVAVTETITSTPAELNLLDTAVADTVVNSKAVIYGSSGEIAASALTVDDIEVDGKVITMTGSSNDTVTMTAATNGEFTLATVDNAAAAAHMNLDADGKIVLNVADNEHVVFETAGTSMFNIGVATAAKGTGATAIGESDGATAIDAFNCSVYQATKYFIIVEDTTNNDLMTTEILLLGDDNPSTAEAFMTVYAVVFNNVELGTFTATTSGDTITLNFVPAAVAGTGSFKVRAVTQRISAI
tara:strand:+ start:16213 stop:18450 length:2238 start_codon:yes stop_codon:yes gene_type:complete